MVRSTSTGDDGCPLGSLFATIPKRGASVAFLSFRSELESRSILVLFTSIFFAQRKSSEEDIHEAVPRRRSGNGGRRSTKGLGRMRWIVMSQFISRAKQCRAEERPVSREDDCQVRSSLTNRKERILQLELLKNGVSYSGTGSAPFCFESYTKGDITWRDPFQRRNIQRGKYVSITTQTQVHPSEKDKMVPGNQDLNHTIDDILDVSSYLYFSVFFAFCVVDVRSFALVLVGVCSLYFDDVVSFLVHSTLLFL